MLLDRLSTTLALKAKEFKARIYESIKINETIRENILPFIETERGKQVARVA